MQSVEDTARSPDASRGQPRYRLPRTRRALQAELEGELRELGLDASGTKLELVERLLGALAARGRPPQQARGPGRHPWLPSPRAVAGL